MMRKYIDILNEAIQITVADLPKSGRVVFDLDNGDTLTVEKRPKGYYGVADDFDVSRDTAEEMVAQLNRWGARVVGWQ